MKVTGKQTTLWEKGMGPNEVKDMKGKLIHFDDWNEQI